MADYILKKTDPANGLIVIPDDTINGHKTPVDPAFYVNSVTGKTAFTADSSLVFIGKSLVEYGEMVQNNFLYLIENFAYKSRPLNPVQGQIWYKNANYTDTQYPNDPKLKGLYLWTGTNWDQLASSAGATSDLDMNNFKVINLADPTNPQDAINLRYANTKYFPYTGGTITGLTTFSGSAVIPSGSRLTITSAPTQNTDGVNKKYVDDNDQAIVDQLLPLINANQTAIQQYVKKTGDTMTGNLTFSPASSIIVTVGGSGTIQLGSRRVQNIADPVAATDAATKKYVDTKISSAIDSLPPPPSSADGVVNAGVFNSTTGVLTLKRSMGLSDVVVQGQLAPFLHNQDSGTILVPTNLPYGQSTIIALAQLGTLTTPTDTLTNVLRVLDQFVTNGRRPTFRKIIKQGTTGITEYNLDTIGGFIVDNNKLSVYVNGIKQIATERGKSIIRFDGALSLITQPIAANGNYTFPLTVGTTNYTVPIVANSLSYYKLYEQIRLYLANNNIPAVITLEQAPVNLFFYIKATDVGIGSKVTTGIGTTFNKISTFNSITNSTITENYSYSEVGVPGTYGYSFKFDQPVAAGSIIEVLVEQ